MRSRWSRPLVQIRVDGPGTVHLSNGTTVEVENDGASELADLIVVSGSGPGADAGVPAEIARGTLPKALACTASESVAGCFTCGST
ncbi:hypothetical protein ABZ897_49905 [Nonomuraea sp. NPDC046802]|uniref:hypothetical protein n=1 Tax=Nonomuraea sp. NPDC046802 TaxID=3154919 RepID=UPI0033DA0DD9